MGGIKAGTITTMRDMSNGTKLTVLKQQQCGNAQSARTARHTDARPFSVQQVNLQRRVHSCACEYVTALVLTTWRHCDVSKRAVGILSVQPQVVGEHCAFSCARSRGDEKWTMLSTWPGVLASFDEDEMN